MPIYEYACVQCGHKLEVTQKISDPAPNPCEACGAQDTMEKQISLTSFSLKGGGWYKDLYSSSKKDGGTSSESGGSAKSESSTAAPSTAAPSNGTGTAASSTPAAKAPSPGGSTPKSGT